MRVCPYLSTSTQWTAAEASCPSPLSASTAARTTRSTQSVVSREKEASSRRAIQWASEALSGICRARDCQPRMKTTDEASDSQWPAQPQAPSIYSATSIVQLVRPPSSASPRPIAPPRSPKAKARARAARPPSTSRSQPRTGAQSARGSPPFSASQRSEKKVDWGMPVRREKKGKRWLRKGCMAAARRRSKGERRRLRRSVVRDGGARS